ncbi:MAG: OB-fold domain-containing protein [Acidimicrobiia bacterium]
MSETSAPFWDATRDRRLVIQWCTACDAPVWFPRDVCLGCLGDALEWRAASGRGEVYAFTVENKPAMPTPFGDEPYVVALVELAEGPRLMTNVVGCPPQSVTVGMPVQVTWEELSDGRNLPLFEPA